MPRNKKACGPAPQAQPDICLDEIIPLTSLKLQGDSVEHRYYRHVYSVWDRNGKKWTVSDPETTYVKSYAQRDSFLDISERNGWRKKQFVFSHMDNIKYIASQLSDMYCGYLLYLQCFIDFNGHLVKSRDNYMSREDIMTTLGIKQRAFHDFMKAMQEHNIIIPDEIDGTKAYRINKEYHFRGHTSNLRVIKGFITEIKKLYKQVSPADLGFVYKLLPWVHFETNILAHNPYEQDPKWVSPLTRDDIASITDVHPRNVYRKMKNLKLGDQYVFESTDTGAYVINPRIFTRREGKPDPTLVTLFEIKNRMYRS
jgi:hypothetical protein